MIGCSHDSGYIISQAGRLCIDCGTNVTLYECQTCTQLLSAENNIFGCLGNNGRRHIIMDGQIQKNGVKKDEGKPRWELLPYDAVKGVVDILTHGAIKYDARNWEKGILYGRIFGALQRHLTTWWNGDSIDAESGLSHLDHALTELMFLSAYEKRKMTEFDDRPVKK